MGTSERKEEKSRRGVQLLSRGFPNVGYCIRRDAQRRGRDPAALDTRFGPPLANNVHAAAGAETVRARLDHLAGVARGSNSARRLHSDRHGAAHKRHVFHGRDSSEKSRRSLHKIGAGLFADLARGQFFIVREKARFQDDLEQRFLRVDNLGDGADVR